MVIIEHCKGCGGVSFNVETIKGYDFLVCGHCKSTVALLSEKKKDDYFPVTYSSYRTDFVIMGSGMVYSGFMNE